MARPCTDTSDSSGPTGGGYCAVQRAFTHSCVACHSASGSAGGLDLQTDVHAALVGVASVSYAGRTLVVAGDSAGSFLTAKLNGSPTISEGALVTGWIDAGATTDCGTDTQATDDTTGAPPVDIYNQTTDLAFAAHTVHVSQGDHPAYDCVQCHTKPADVTAIGHFLISDATPGEASWERMSGEHHKHVNDARLGCETCHGTVDVTLPEGMTYAGVRSGSPAASAP